jgi:uncharacterized lipoprotein YddW (UPF0748 family)
MKRIYIIIFIVLISWTTLLGTQQELRGAWVAWAGTNVPSTDEIATTMDELAAANFNIVYVDVWRYGYPYFKSDVFHKYARYYTDPNLGDDHLQPDRDVLAEMIAEAHRVGLHVEAWFEAGFNGAATTESPLFQMKPEWFAKKKDGSTAYYGQAGPSMIHCHPEVQQFLIDLAQEIVQEYDVDGIQLDRIRYPSTDCGYDTLTVNLYKEEHNGSPPPSNINDQEWVQWRADKLTDFIGRIYDSLKTVNPEIIISNATIPWDPMQFCQDWSEWANNGYLDILIPMLYWNTDSYFTYQLENNQELNQVNNFEIVYPGVTTVANESFTDPVQLEAMIRTTREKELGGNIFWYADTLIWHENEYLTHLKETVYDQPAEIPYRPSNWRQPAIIIDDTASSINKTDGWQSYSGAIPLYNGQCSYANIDNSDSIEYFVDIEKAGWYEVYAFVNTQVNATTTAKYHLHSADSDQIINVDQTIKGNAGRWEKLTDLHLPAGSDQHLLTLTAGDGEGSFLFTDAIMLLNTNRPEEYLTEITKPPENRKTNLNKDFILNQNYPNPFNSSTTISFKINKPDQYKLCIYDVTGNKIKTLFNKELDRGKHKIQANLRNFPSGLYFYRLNAPWQSLTGKMLFVK